MTSLVVFYLIVQLVLLIPFVLILWVVSRITRARAQGMRTVALVLCATVLFTPGWGPATITAVPVPFGLLLGIALFSFHFNEALGVLKIAPLWYAIAFPATAFIVYMLRRTLLKSNVRYLALK